MYLLAASSAGTHALDLRVADLCGDAAGSRCIPPDAWASRSVLYPHVLLRKNSFCIYEKAMFVVCDGAAFPLHKVLIAGLAARSFGRLYLENSSQCPRPRLEIINQSRSVRLSCFFYSYYQLQSTAVLWFEAKAKVSFVAG